MNIIVLFFVHSATGKMFKSQSCANHDDFGEYKA